MHRVAYGAERGGRGAGFRAIARARRPLPPECPVVLRSPSRAARKLLAATGLDRVYPIEDAPG